MCRSINLLRNMVTSMKCSKGFDKVYQSLEVVKASKGRCTLQWKIDDSLLNVKETLHGGLICSIVDTATTMALTTATEGARGVSLDLNVSFLGPSQSGDTLTVEACCLKVGKTVAFTEASITNQKGKLVATGKHTKFLQSPQQNSSS